MAAYASRQSYSSSQTSATPQPVRSSWSDGRGLPQNSRKPRSLPHIKDIVAAADPEVKHDDSPNALLQKAEAYVQSSVNAKDFARPDNAYRDYLRCYTIVAQYIPQHRDYGFACDNVNGFKRKFDLLRKILQDLDPQMARVKHLIEDDNARTGVLPNTRHESPPQKVYDTGFGMADGRPNSGQTTTSVPESLQVGRQRPATRPKPGSLSGLVPPNTSTDLSQRFARLRTPSNQHEAVPEFTMPRVEDYQNGHLQGAESASATTNGYPEVRPNGPRDMTTAGRPSVPPKVPLSTAGLSMPKPPSPTYSPSTVQAQYRMPNLQTRPPTEKKQMYYNQPLTSLHLQRTREENPYRPRTPNGSVIIAKNSSTEIPLDSAITAEKLAEYLRKYNVLMIDVRERELFDEGHIHHNSILCIEPVALNKGVSAEELEDRLVVSPEAEQILFERRNEFDIVVYYDQATSNTKYLSGPPTGSNTPALRALYDTLYEFNDYKRLKDGRPPALLLGGINAWVDLMSSNSLATSKTAATLGSTRRRTVSVAARQRNFSHNSALEVRKRRMREYTPLNADEEQAWRSRAQQEEVIEYAEPSTDGEQIDGEEPEPLSPFVNDYETFLRKFPDVGVQQSMTMPMRSAPAPPRYQAPAIPPVPSRPTPAMPRPSYSGQAEISQPQASLARVTSATRPPLYSSSTFSRRMRLPKTGLTNFGVTCYMNATLQCLSGTSDVTRFFLEDRYKGYIQKNWKGSSGIMPDLYANVVRSLWKGDVEVIKPSTFRNFCGRMNREWVIDRQQDAKEFFDFLVDCLHEDLNVNWNRTPLRPLTAGEEAQRERMHFQAASPFEWQRFQHRDYSYISSLFAGQHASRLRCRTCRSTSTTYEAFYSISIEIPQSGRGDIYDCLRHYTQEEMLSGDEVWKCPNCKCEREATKQIILTRLPQILVIHFKRFSASKTETVRKIHTPIDFPLHNLQMDDFVVAKPAEVLAAEQDRIERGESKVDLASTAPFNYDCYGVLRHLGNTGNGGHYVSIVRDQGREVWRKFDDERPMDVELRPRGREHLQSGEAYIVFYQRAGAR